MRNNEEIAEMVGLKDTNYFASIKSTSREKYDKMMELGKDDLFKGFNAYCEWVDGLINEANTLYYHLQGTRGSIHTFSKEVCKAGLSKNPQSVYTFFSNTFSSVAPHTKKYSSVQTIEKVLKLAKDLGIDYDSIEYRI